MADYRDLIWQIAAELPGAPKPLLYSHFANAIRQFFSESKAWQHNSPDALDLAADTAFPTVSAGTEIPTSTYVVEPVRIKWSDGQNIPFKTRDQLDDIDGDWEQATGTKSEYWTITSPGTFRLYPLLSSSQTGVLYLRSAIAPVFSMTSALVSIPDYLANEYQEAWTHGALARLMAIPGKDWTNVNLARSYGSLFEQDIKMAKSRAAADYGRPVRQVQYGGLSIGGSGSPVSDDYGR